MSYLAQPTSNVDYGVVKIGNNISVNAGVIFLEQDLSSNASVIFANVSANAVYSNGQLVVTQVNPYANDGIALSNVFSNGAVAEFTIRNTGVLSINAGPGISVSNTTGNITISANGADLMATYGTSTNYTATSNDEYIGVFSANAVTITLPTGVTGRVYTIKDEYGQGSGKITIQPQVGEKIDNATNYIISVPFQSVACVFRAGSWRII
jgi:hypothetical protein